MYLPSQTKHIQDKCGVVGIVTKEYEQSLSFAIDAARGVQHRGTQGAGIAIHTKEGVKTYKRDGLLQDIFTPSTMQSLDEPCDWAMVHCRYGTHGDYNHMNLQPCHARSPEGDVVSVIHNGEFVQVNALRSVAEKRSRRAFQKSTSDTLLFTQALAFEKGKKWDTKIKKAVSQAKGAYSLIVGVQDSLYAIRDRHGVRPLFIGEYEGSTWMVASETHAFDKVGMSVLREVAPGEIVKLTSAGIIVVQDWKTLQMAEQGNKQQARTLCEEAKYQLFQRRALHIS